MFDSEHSFVLPVMKMYQQKTIDSAPATYISSFDLFNHTYQLYTHR